MGGGKVVNPCRRARKMANYCHRSYQGIRKMGKHVICCRAKA